MATAFALTTLVALSAPVNAANNEGGKCAKAGVSVTVVGKKLICTKSGKTLKWVVAFINPVALTDIKWSDNIRPTKDFSRPIWVKILGTTRDDEVAALSVSSSGRIAVAGTTDGDIDGRYPNRLWDAFVAVYDGRGRQLWIRKFGTPQDDFARSVAIDSTGGVWVVGETLGGMEGNVNAGEQDAFLAKFQPMVRKNG